MKIVVLVKQVPDTSEERTLDPSTGWLRREDADNVVDEINERALEVALQIKDQDKSTQVVAMSMGPEEAAKGIRKALSMGADSGVHILDDGLAGADAARTAAVLAEALKSQQADVVLGGNESTDGRGGVVPAMIAEHLGLPLLGSLRTVDFSGGRVTGERQGDATTEVLSAALPAIVTVNERSAEARFPNFKGILTAKRKPVETVTAAELGIGASPAHTVILASSERPARVAGVKIVDDGSAGTTLAAFLVDNRLV